MDNVRLSENLIKLRKDKRVTQEQLAEFCGVTKASVSKWETAQSLPDILLLPRLAAFFSVSIDELMGYEIHLSMEQIHKIHGELAMDFATKEFDVAMERCRSYVKQYYSCHELLEEIILLWISHELLAGDKRTELLEEAKKLCRHILKNSKSIPMCNDITFLQAVVDLLLGNPEATVEVLEEMNNPLRLSIQSEEVLLSAYIEQGHLDKGNEFAQISMYVHIFMLVSDGCRFLVIHRNDLEKCEETLRRVDAVMKLYNFYDINFYLSALFVYQMAEVYCCHGEKQKAIEMLAKYVDLYERYLSGKIGYMQDDDYLDKLHMWCENSISAGSFPREKKTVYFSMIAALEAPVFDGLYGEEDYLNLLKKAKNWEVVLNSNLGWEK